MTDWDMSLTATQNAPTVARTISSVPTSTNRRARQLDPGKWRRRRVLSIRNSRLAACVSDSPTVWSRHSRRDPNASNCSSNSFCQGSTLLNSSALLLTLIRLMRTHTARHCVSAVFRHFPRSRASAVIAVRYFPARHPVAPPLLLSPGPLSSRFFRRT